MRIYEKFYMAGKWVTPDGKRHSEVINPATEEVVTKVPAGNETDVDNAVKAAHEAFASWSQTSAKKRADYLRAIAKKMKARRADFETVMVEELGVPISLVWDLQVSGPIGACEGYADRCAQMDEVEHINNSIVVKEPVGVCALINPWNYPLSQLIGKVAPALAAGCTMIVKAASQTPSHAFILAEIMDEVGLPAGVFNLVHGSGQVIGEAMSSHPLVDMVSFTGSTDAGIRVAQLAAPMVKRVCQELGGKSPYIITEDADLEAAVKYGVNDVMYNTGQSCNALTRMLVPEVHYEEAIKIAKNHAESLPVGDPNNTETIIGPMSSASQKATVIEYINKGIAEGARLVVGGTDLPAGIDKGAYVKPTIFADVDNKMTIAQEEIFGPVLCIIPTKDEDEAVAIANDTIYGLSSGVWAKDKESGQKLARRIRAGVCFVNGGKYNYDAPFGGYKQSGNGREWGDEGLSEYTETKAIQM